jgi:TonB family protein
MPRLGLIVALVVACHSGRSGDAELASRRRVYKSFFDRFKREVRQNWSPATVWKHVDPTGTLYGSKERVTKVRVSLSPKGELANILVVSSSGSAELDEEGLRAIRVSAPFPDPPDGLIEKDNLITFEFSFYFELDRPRVPAQAAAPPPNVPPWVLEAHRIAGEKTIVPDDLTRTGLGEAGKDKLTGAYKLCIAIDGSIASVTQLKTTGFPRYDEKIIHTIRGEWRYRPFLVNGNAATVCTAVTFTYSQAPPLPPDPSGPPASVAPSAQPVP